MSLNNNSRNVRYWEKGKPFYDATVPALAEHSRIFRLLSQYMVLGYALVYGSLVFLDIVRSCSMTSSRCLAQSESAKVRCGVHTLKKAFLPTRDL